MARRHTLVRYEQRGCGLSDRDPPEVSFEAYLAGRRRGHRVHRVEALRSAMLAAYRWQYIVTGVRNERFQHVLGSMVTEAQMARIGRALAPILGEPAVA